MALEETCFRDYRENNGLKIVNNFKMFILNMLNLDKITLVSNSFITIF